MHKLYRLIPLLLCAACVTRQPATESGGVPLPGTEDAACAGPGDPFWLSPDGRWLVFRTETDDPFLPDLVVRDLTDPLDRDGTARRRVTPTEEAATLAAEGRGPVPSTACWGAGRLAFQGHGVAFGIDPATAVPTLETLPAMPCDGGAAAAVSTAVAVEHPSPKTARLVAADGTQLAEYQARDAGATHLLVEHLLPSPGSRYWTYSITEMQASFATPTQGFLLDLKPDDGMAPAEPRLLAAPLYGSPRWDPDGRTLYACVGHSPGTPRIVRWRLPQSPGESP